MYFVHIKVFYLCQCEGKVHFQLSFYLCQCEGKVYVTEA